MTDRPMNRRGTPVQRFNPLRDAPSAHAGLGDEPFDVGLGEVETPVDLVVVITRHVGAMGLLDTPEGALAVTAAEKAVESTGSAAAACLHELRMIMDAIRAANPASSVSDPTEDILGRRRRERGA